MKWNLCCLRERTKETQILNVDFVCTHFCADCVLEQCDFCYRITGNVPVVFENKIARKIIAKYRPASAEFVLVPLPSPHQWDRLIGYGDRGSKGFSGRPSSDLSKADKHAGLHRDITIYSDVEVETFVTRHRCKQLKRAQLCPLDQWWFHPFFFSSPN